MYEVAPTSYIFVAEKSFTVQCSPHIRQFSCFQFENCLM